MQTNPENKKSFYRGHCYFLLSFLCFLSVISQKTYGQPLQLNDLGYFEERGVNVLPFCNQFNGFFFDEKTAGIELIHHGVRTATGGAVRLQNTPEQWDLVPFMVDRKIDKGTNTVEVVLRYKEYDFDSKVRVTSSKDGILISVFLDKPLPAALIGRAGFNMEFLPASYFEKTYLADGKPGIFPLYPSGTTIVRPVAEKIPQFAGHSTFDDRGRGEFIEPMPLDSCKTLVFAPEDPERRVTIQSEAELMLFDGRNLAQNGWFVVRSLIPSGKTGNVLQWVVKPNAIPNWIRTPVIGFSQAGYHPDQEKIAVIELDNNDIPLKKASLYRITPEGESKEILSADLKPWGKYLRYNYVKFDFSSVKESGLYFIKYGGQETNTFVIDTGVYDNIWHATMDVWFPVQMDHMEVNEAYRIWHGVPYLDDALQAPVNHQHFDGYSMGPTTDTKYKPLERIPNMAVGGWFDAGDFDIQTGSHNSVILSFADAWERFRPDRDETYIDHATRYVDIHRPDGKPDILQQIEHGTLNVVAQMQNIGHPVRGIIVPNLHQYHHLGDASTETDNLPYNPNLKPYESDGKSSGTLDDRWAFTNRITELDYHSIAALAAANRVLKDANSRLADDCLTEAKRLWEEDKNVAAKADTVFGKFRANTELMAALQLFITTKDEQYAKRFNEILWPFLDKATGPNMAVALQAIPYFGEAYRTRLKDYVIKYKALNDGFDKENPYGVPISARGWAGNTIIVNWAITNYYANKLYPDIIGSEYVFKGLNYILGCHPYSNISFVSTVGTRSKKITYGNNRADFRFIAGGVVPGVLLLKPDFLENKEDWPFLWGENECVIDTGAAWVLLSCAVNELLKK
jgi:endoglucanase